MSSQYIKAELQDRLNKGNQSEYVSSFDPKKVDLKDYKIRQKEQRVNDFYLFGYITSSIIILVWAGLVLLEQPVPDYLIGFIGTIMAFFLLKRPYE